MFAENLKALRKSRRLSLDNLSKEINKMFDTNISKSMLSRWENGQVDPQMKYVQMLADFFKVNPIELIDDNNLDSDLMSLNSIYTRLNSHRRVKVYNYAAKQLSEQNEVHETPLKYLADFQPQHDIVVQSVVSAGTGILDLDTETTETISYRGQVPSSYDLAFKVSGNSMEPTFKDGDIIFVEKSKNPINGAFMVVQVYDEAFIKKVYLENDKLRLVSLNPDYDDCFADEHNEIRIVGKVVF